MKIVIAPDSFKGSMSSKQICNIVEASAVKVFPSACVIKVPIADGGEGTLEAIISSLEGKLRYASVRGPFKGKNVRAAYGVFKDTAIIEMSQASGLTLLDKKERDPLETTSFGTGELILRALNDGCKKILIGIGGSATNDGGMGAMQALGVKFFDRQNRLITNGAGKELINIGFIDVKGLDKRIQDTQITVMCDVNNPLTGETGATKTYGPQKGADGKSLELLESGMLNYEKQLNTLYGSDICSHAGTGAAGGLGAALMVFLNAEPKRGIQAVLDFVGFENIIKGADLIITGEGRVDYQSAYGKVIWGVAEAARTNKIPVIALTGGIGEGAEALYKIGVNSIFPIINNPMTLDEAINNACDLLRSSTLNLFQIIKLGICVNPANGK